MIELINVCVNYPMGNIGIYDASFSLNRGECKALIGRAGSGKSTIIQSINGLLKLSSGDIKVDGMSVKDRDNITKIRQRVGLVMQYPDYQLFAETVYDDIAFGPRNFGKSEEEVRELVISALKKTTLTEDYLNRNPLRLSGGEKRKVALAGVLAIEPSYLLLDEPTSGLDPGSSREFLEVFMALKEAGTGILFSSHNPEEVAMISDGIIVLYKNRLIKEAGIEIYEDRAFLSEVELAPPIITDFMLSLKDKGYDVRGDVFNIEDAIEEIERCLR